MIEISGRRWPTRAARRAATVAVVLLMATALVSCQNAKVGGRCKAGTVAQDATHVLTCKKGRWTRLISKADGLRELARIKAEQEAAARPAATTPNPPDTGVLVPPNPAPVVTVPAATTTTPAVAQDVDTSFGTGGALRVPLPRQSQLAVSVAATPGGTVYQLMLGSGPNEVRRLLASGDPDPTFGTGGAVPAPFTQCTQCRVGVDSSNRLYVWNLDMAPTAQTRYTIVRYTPAGAVDPSYGDAGTAHVAIGELPVDGYLSDSGTMAFVSGRPRTVRWLSENGRTVTSTATSLCGSQSAATFDHANRLLIMTISCSSPYTTSLTRFGGDGELDAAFGVGGTATVAPTLLLSPRVVVDPSNRPYVAQDLTVRRLTTAGVADGGYGAGGTAVLPTTGGRTVLGAVVATASGVVASLSPSSGPQAVDFVISKLDDAGAPDSGFGTGGVLAPAPFATPIASAFGSPNTFAPALVAFGSGVLVLADTAVTDPVLGVLPVNAALALTSTGSPIGAYGTNGLTTFRFGLVGVRLAGTWPGPTGSFYVALRSAASSGVALFRATAAGAPDTGFSGDGFATDASAVGVTVDGQGRAVLYRTISPASTMSFGSSGQAVTRSITRLTVAGSPDPSFDGDGTAAWSDLPAGVAGNVQCAAALEALGDDSVVVAYGPTGGSPECSTTGFDVVSAGGGLTTGWGSGFATASGGRSARDVAAAPGNRLVVLASTPGDPVSRVVRLQRDGTADGSFAGGSLEVDAATSGQVDVLGDGSIVVSDVSGSAMSYSETSLSFRRFTAGGAPVSGGGYDATGRRVADHSRRLAVTAGHIVGTGWSGGNTRAVVFRPDATLDGGFPFAGSDGIAETPGAEWDDRMTAVSAQRLYVVTANFDSVVEIHKFNGMID